jgi:PAS domain S-box-containing protein
MSHPLRHSPAELAAVHASEGLLVADWERILFLNQRLQQLLDVRADELIGQPIERLGDFISEPETVDRLRNAFRQGQPFQGEVTRRQADGSQFAVELIVTPVPPDSGPGAVAGGHWMVVVAIRDLRHSKRLEHQLWQSQRLDAVTNLADGVAHEMNNVVQVLAGYGSLIAETLPKDDPRGADLKAIEVAARRGGALLKELLAFARRRPSSRSPLDLNEVIRSWADLIQVLVGAEIRLILDLADDLPPVSADRGEVQQILLNLLSNARDAMSPAGGTLTIVTHEVVPGEVVAKASVDERIGEYVVLTVADTGVGMSSDTKAQLFEPFFTTKDDRGSRGLGLATVHEIVRESGGLVWVRSRPGEGTSVEVHFPALRSPAVEPAPAAVGRVELPSGSETLLVVDDDVLVLRVASRSLERLGYRVFSAGSAAQATAIAAEHGRELDLLLTDVSMPGQRGPGLAEELQGEWPHLKVLFMTGYPLESSPLGADAPHLAKPFSPEELAQAIRTALGAGR